MVGGSKPMSSYDGYLKVKEKFEEYREKVKQEAIKKYEENPLLCKQCATKIAYERRNNNLLFCNRSCSAKYNNSRRNSKKEIKKCLNCSLELVSKHTSQRYCSVKCQQSLKKEERYQKLSSGDDSGIGHVAARNAVIAKHGNKCMECGWDKISPYTNKCPIELEHIDGNSQNNKLDNLRLLCPSCHSLTATYKALNKGNGRHKRKLRYQEGKSY